MKNISIKITRLACKDQPQLLYMKKRSRNPTESTVSVYATKGISLASYYTRPAKLCCSFIYPETVLGLEQPNRAFVYQNHGKTEQNTNHAYHDNGKYLNLFLHQANLARGRRRYNVTRIRPSYIFCIFNHTCKHGVVLSYWFGLTAFSPS